MRNDVTILMLAIASAVVVACGASNDTPTPLAVDSGAAKPDASSSSDASTDAGSMDAADSSSGDGALGD